MKVLTKKQEMEACISERNELKKESDMIWNIQQRIYQLYKDSDGISKQAIEYLEISTMLSELSLGVSNKVANCDEKIANMK